MTRLLSRIRGGGHFFLTVFWMGEPVMSRLDWSLAGACWILVCALLPTATRKAEPQKPRFDYQVVMPAFNSDDEPAAARSGSIVTSAIGPDDARAASGETPSGSRAGDAPLSAQQIALSHKIRQVLNAYFPKHQNTRDNNAWEIMHEIIAFGVDSQLYQNGPGGPKVSAIGWMCYNGTCKGEQMLYLDRGQLVARKGPGVQGHFGQFLAILAQSHLTADYPMLVFGKKFTLRDLIEVEKQDCQAGEELTFKLIGLMHYLDSDETWNSRDGQVWSIQRLISEELKQPIRGAACGGTHRLMGLSYAVNKRGKRGEPIDGEFRRAQTFINDYHRYTFGLQNPDGSFSTQWFVRREAKPDVDRRLKTTGHILEWLAFSLSDDELRQPQVVKAVDYLATILAAGQDHTWEIGPLGHGLHALSLYDQRMFRDAPVERHPAVAGKGEPRTRQLEPKELRPAEPDVAKWMSAPTSLPRTGQRQPAERPAARPQPGRAAVTPAKVGPRKPAPAPAHPERPVLEMAEKPSLLDRPACRIGNDVVLPLTPPDAGRPEGDADDEGCL